MFASAACLLYCQAILRLVQGGWGEVFAVAGSSRRGRGVGRGVAFRSEGDGDIGVGWWRWEGGRIRPSFFLPVAPRTRVCWKFWVSTFSPRNFFLGGDGGEDGVPLLSALLLIYFFGGIPCVGRHGDGGGLAPDRVYDSWACRPGFSWGEEGVGSFFLLGYS